MSTPNSSSPIVKLTICVSVSLLAPSPSMVHIIGQSFLLMYLPKHRFLFPASPAMPQSPRRGHSSSAGEGPIAADRNRGGVGARGQYSGSGILRELGAAASWKP